MREEGIDVDERRWKETIAEREVDESGQLLRGKQIRVADCWCLYCAYDVFHPTVNHNSHCKSFKKRLRVCLLTNLPTPSLPHLYFILLSFLSFPFFHHPDCILLHLIKSYLSYIVRYRHKEHGRTARTLRQRIAP